MPSLEQHSLFPGGRFGPAKRNWCVVCHGLVKNLIPSLPVPLGSVVFSSSLHPPPPPHSPRVCSVSVSVSVSVSLSLSLSLDEEVCPPSLNGYYVMKHENYRHIRCLLYFNFSTYERNRKTWQTRKETQQPLAAFTSGPRHGRNVSTALGTYVHVLDCIILLVSFMQS